MSRRYRNELAMSVVAHRELLDDLHRIRAQRLAGLLPPEPPGLVNGISAALERLRRLEARAVQKPTLARRMPRTRVLRSRASRRSRRTSSRRSAAKSRAGDSGSSDGPAPEPPRLAASLVGGAA